MSRFEGIPPLREPLGRDGLPGGFSAAHQQYWIRCKSDVEEAVVAGEVAYALCRDSTVHREDLANDVLAMFDLFSHNEVGALLARSPEQEPNRS